MSDIFSSNSPLLALSNNLADAVERSSRAVVAVNARSRISSSGVHWRSGVIVTADHAIKREDDITVTLPDGRSLPAALAGRDSSTDIAILKLENPDLPVAEIGDASELKVGHLTLAIGLRGESGAIASMGVVSSVGGAWRSWYGSAIDQFISLDLNLYPGMDGGPLVDAGGRVAGINTFGPRNLVLAIPASTVSRVVDQLLETGRIARGYLGLSMQSVTLPDSLTSALNLPSSGGAIAVNVEIKGPADRGGILIGDVLVSFDGTPVSDTGDVLAMLGPDRVGKTVPVQVIRGGALFETKITVGERPRREE